jgi:hypothetical protein
MSQYASQLHAFHRAIVHEEHAAMLPLIKRARDNEFPVSKRLQVYLDAYEIRLEQATRMDYPALEHYIGAEALQKALHAFVRATPSHVWDLNQYPLHFAEFFCRTTSDALAQSLAQLEAAITEVFWKPDSEALEPAALAAIDMEALAVRVFTPRAALKLLELPREANAYLSAFREGTETAGLAHAPEYLCVVRHPRNVQRVVLAPDEYSILQALFSGVPFGDALATAAAPPETLAAALPGYLQRWLLHGMFAA